MNSVNVNLKYKKYLVDISTVNTFAPLKIRKWTKLKEMGLQTNTKQCNAFLDEIKGTFFFQMHRINLVMFRLANKYLLAENFPIKSEQIPVLMSIYNGTELSQQDVADNIHRDKSSVQRTILVLQKKGLITISPHQTDKRKNVLRTTKEGGLLSEQLTKIIKKVDTEMLKTFDREEAKSKIESVKVIADNLEQLYKIKH